jgi:hypothetical protein
VAGAFATNFCFLRVLITVSFRHDGVTPGINPAAAAGPAFSVMPKATSYLRHRTPFNLRQPCENEDYIQKSSNNSNELAKCSIFILLHLERFAGLAQAGLMGVNSAIPNIHRS